MAKPEECSGLVRSWRTNVDSPEVEGGDQVPAGVGGTPKMVKLELQTIRLQVDRPKCPDIPVYKGEEGDIAEDI